MVVDMFEDMPKSDSQTTVSQARIVLDTHAVQTVQRAITKELLASTEEMYQRIGSGELGDKALQNCLEQAKVLRTRATEYESILQAPLSDCQMLITMAEAAANQALAVKEQKDAFADIF